MSVVLLIFIQRADSEVSRVYSSIKYCNGTTSIIHIDEPQLIEEGSSKLALSESTTPSMIVPKVPLACIPTARDKPSHKEDSELEELLTEEDTNSNSISMKPSQSTTSYDCE